MKKLIVLAAIVAAAIYFKPQLQDFLLSAGGSPDGKAKHRVKVMLESWKKGGTSSSADAQTAICQWAQGVSFIGDRDALGAYSDGFDRFRREKDLYRAISSFDVVDAKVDDQDKSKVRVSCTIDGSNYDLIVVDKEPIRWAS